jgi:hypothetical protein
VEEARDNLREAFELFIEAASPEKDARRLSGEIYVIQLEIARWVIRMLHAPPRRAEGARTACRIA